MINITVLLLSLKDEEIEYKENFRGLERIVREAANKTRDYGLGYYSGESYIRNYLSELPRFWKISYQ